MKHPNWDNLNDTQRTYWLLKQSGMEGVHSWELAEQVPTRNPSQRVKDCVSKGQDCFVTTERRNGRAGSRYWLGENNNPPAYASKVEPNFGSAAASGEATGSSQPVIGEGAVGRFELYRDYTDPKGKWEERPLKEAA